MEEKLCNLLELSENRIFFHFEIIQYSEMFYFCSFLQEEFDKIKIFLRQY